MIGIKGFHLMNKNLHKNRNGFTLAELLIVVAIIGVLVAISIPIFTNQMERSREAVDLANVRAAYAQVMSDAVTENKIGEGSTYDTATNRYSMNVNLVQKQIGWQSSNVTIAGITPSDTVHWIGQVLPGSACTVFYDADSSSVTLLWSGLTVKNDYQWKYSNGKLSLNNASVVNSWTASSIPNAIDSTLNDGKTFTVGALSDKLKAATENGKYQFEIGYFITKADGTVIVDSGYIVLDDNQRTLNITTEEQKLLDQGSNAYSIINKDVTAGEDCKVCVQLFKVVKNDGNRSGAIKLTDDEVSELSNLITF